MLRYSKETVEFVGQVLKSGPGPVLLGIMRWSGLRLGVGEPIGDRKISYRDSHVRPGPHKAGSFSPCPVLILNTNTLPLISKPSEKFS